MEPVSPETSEAENISEELENEQPKFDKAAVKKQFSTIGFAILAMFIITSILQVACRILVNALVPALLETDWITWVITFVPEYLIGVPVGLLILKKLPASHVEGKQLSFGYWLTLIPIAIALMYAGNLLGLMISNSIGASGESPVTSYAMSNSMVLKILIMVILAPIIEEFIFRKTLIDRIRVFDEKTAVITSAMIFGLFHANLQQFVYATAVGLLFGYVYLKTGKLRYSIGLHMILNYIGSILSVNLLQQAQAEMPSGLDLSALESAENLEALTSPGIIAFGFYVIGILVFVIAGGVLLAVRASKLRFETAPQQIPQGKAFGMEWKTPGMIVFTIVMVLMIIITLLIG